MNILFVCRHPEISETVVRLLQQQWSAAFALTNEEALALFQHQKFDLVLMGSGVDTDEEAFLTNAFRQHDPTIKIVQHFGGGSGLLFNEIQEAIRNKP